MRSPQSLWTKVRVYPAEEVTTRAQEADPREVDLTPQGMAEIWAAVVRLYETGLHPAIGLCVRRRGQVVLDRAIGHLRGNEPGRPLDAPRTLVRHDSLFNFFS